ncbi:hypothetical protein AVEN_106917-1 [Araneus ventricosus]|uniref:Uncharacterized protein n=1 Tax=Araneus ventricosus TaxID=182803 RepID=A0A4Y2NQN1_ARAVE|nr:hypothetical protein AVEN_106917-1 [Araneus ventricosus]
MKSFLSLQKFQKDDTQAWAINCQQRNEPLFSLKIHSGARNSLSPASVEWGGLWRDRAHRINGSFAEDKWYLCLRGRHTGGNNASTTKPEFAIRGGHPWC